ncbi:hypothetical protein B0H14DRAFT_3584908 [Mycena olivaceomarginata]|nr:hypothetical protein B0H14DRAFT_3584908 [Mycena olivaceomarginata]
MVYAGTVRATQESPDPEMACGESSRRALDTEKQGQGLMPAAAEPDPDSKRWVPHDTAVSVYLPRAHLTLNSSVNTIPASAICDPRPPHAHPMQLICTGPIRRAWMPRRRPTTDRWESVEMEEMLRKQETSSTLGAAREAGDGEMPPGTLSVDGGSSTRRTSGTDWCDSGELSKHAYEQGGAPASPSAPSPLEAGPGLADSHVRLAGIPRAPTFALPLRSESTSASPTSLIIVEAADAYTRRPGHVARLFPASAVCAPLHRISRARLEIGLVPRSSHFAPARVASSHAPFVGAALPAARV